MIRLRKLPTVWNKSVLKSYKSSLSRSKLLGVLLKSERTSSVTQVIRFLNVEENSREPSTNTEDDTSKEVTKILSGFSTPTQRGTSIRRLKEDLQKDADSASRLKSYMSVEDLKKFIKMADTQNLNGAMSVIYNLCHVLKSKYYLTQSISRYKNVESLISPNELKEVFERVERDLTLLDDFSLLKIFEACTILRISDSSSLMQKLIKILSSNINSCSSLNVLNIYCIIKMYYSNDNPQIAALKFACSELLNNCFESNIHPKSKPTTMSTFVCLEYLPKHVRECLIKKIFESKSNLPIWSYTNILKGLAGLYPYTEFHRECVDSIIKEVKNLLETNYTPISLFIFLKSYRVGFLRGLIPYSESFLDTVALNLRKWEFPLGVDIESCRCFFQMGHFNYALFDYVASKAGNALTSGEFKKLSSFEFYCLTKILSAAGRKNTKIMNNFFIERLQAACSFYPKFETFLKIPLAVNLAILGIYEDRLIEPCFTSENGGEITEVDLEELNEFKKNLLLLLHQAVVTFHPSYQKPLLSEELVKNLSAKQFAVSPTHNVWQDTVESFFGGPNFVLKNCTTPLHHCLNYVVVLDKNNVPVDLTSIQGANTQATGQPFNIADIPTSEETQLIVIQDIWNEGQVVFRNVSSWKGSFQLYLDVLEMYCDGVITLLFSEFKSLTSLERVPFLLSKIEKKFGVIGKPMNAKSER